VGRREGRGEGGVGGEDGEGVVVVCYRKEVIMNREMGGEGKN
jgi:hypothetical protein